MSAEEDGTPFGRYRLIALLGRGGMGEVWRAHDTDTDRTVALKLLPANLSADDDFQRRFRREAHAAARLNSPHVIPIHHYGEIDGRLYVDMRLVEGHDLQTLLRGGPLEPVRAVHIIGQVAEALRAAHEVGLLHRDIKPSNILIDRNDFAYLIDFGIARVLGETRMTKSGNTIGTFQYIAPERLGTGTEDARADIYSLACVLYECLTGGQPFQGDSMEQQVVAHLTLDPPRPSDFSPAIPAGFDEVVATGMAKDPGQRYATTVEFADAAREAITVPVDTPTASPPRSAATRPATQPATVKAPPPVVPPPQQPAAAATTGGISRRTTLALIGGGAAAAIAAAAAIPTLTKSQPSQSPRTSSSPPTTPPERPYGAQIELPFTDLGRPEGVAVDGAGDVYVSDTGNHRVLKLTAGSSQTVLPFTGLSADTSPGASNGLWLAADGAGDLYVADTTNDRVLKLAAGTATQTVLPFSGLDRPRGVAVDSGGNVYVADNGPGFQPPGYSYRVVKLAAGANTQTLVPFIGLDMPQGVAVDGPGNLYVADMAMNRVLKLAAGTGPQTELPFTDLGSPDGVAVDGAGNIYVTQGSHNRVLKLSTAAGTQTVLPFTGLNVPLGVAVDGAGNVYVTDTRNRRVLKLPVE